jgi:hypothetical protein
VQGRSRGVALSFLYWSLRRLLELVALSFRSEGEKEIEFRVPRTQEESRGECFGFSAAVLCGEMGVWPSGVAVQGEAPSHPVVRRLRAVRAERRWGKARR